MADLNRLVDELSALTILEASELKKLLEEKWGVTAASGGGMMMMAAPAAGGAAAAAAPEPVEEQTEFNVILDDVGPKKINVIKAVRQVTNLGLKEAKDLVEAEKPLVLEAVSKDKANEAKTIIEAEGAKIVIK
ncbi:MAG: 50S ribosomal protein L7/L12 [Chloroflexi bacterium]|uniref:50S ribosomal protein L7/L12 n=1 Tax=Candidatus Flexifilum breve TaxID=3140694 RepID=UPI0031353A34|nr:50S ribosomal protein L7/L12 [Chloroflexota bacterium]MBK9751574.1 50S ribosomal protein L7/L12 [Chloroflexota bacterium]